MQDRRDAGQEECRTGGMQGWSDAGQEGCRTGGMRSGGMQGLRDAGQELCRTGGMQLRWDPELEGCTVGGMQDRRDAGRTWPWFLYRRSPATTPDRALTRPRHHSHGHRTYRRSPSCHP